MTNEPKRKYRTTVFDDRQHSEAAEAKDSLLGTIYFVAELALLLGLVTFAGWLVS